MSDGEYEKREIILTRTYDAPVDVLYKAFTDADEISKWWGPEGFSAPKVVSDARPGGEFSVVMMDGDGVEYPMHGTYTEVIPLKKLVFEGAPVDAGGSALLEAGHTVEFHDHGGKTKLVVTAYGRPLSDTALAMVAGMRSGWNQSLQCLDDVVTGTADRQLVFIRMLNTSPEKAFDMWVKLEHLDRWWGPDGFTTTTEEINVREGGTWKFVMHSPEGTDYPNLVTYDEVKPGERLTYTQGTLGTDWSFRTVVNFDEFMGKTVLTMRQIFQSASARDAAAKEYHAMDGANQTLNKLVAVVDEQGALVS